MSRRKCKFPNRIEKDIEESSSPTAAHSSSSSMTGLLDEELKSTESIEEYSLELSEGTYVCTNDK